MEEDEVEDGADTRGLEDTEKYSRRKDLLKKQKQRQSGTPRCVT